MTTAREVRRPRKVLGIVLEHGRLLAVCDDGSTWLRRGDNDSWVEKHPVPGTDRALQLALRVTVEVEAEADS